MPSRHLAVTVHAFIATNSVSVIRSSLPTTQVKHYIHASFVSSVSGLSMNALRKRQHPGPGFLQPAVCSLGRDVRGRPGREGRRRRARVRRAEGAGDRRPGGSRSKNHGRKGGTRQNTPTQSGYCCGSSRPVNVSKQRSLF